MEARARDTKEYYTNNGETKVRLSIEKDAQNDALQDKLDEKIEENKELALQLEQISAIEFSKQCIQNGLDPAIATPSDLERAKIEKKMNNESPRGQTETANYYSPRQQGENLRFDTEDVPISMISAETPEQLIAIAEKKAKLGDKDSQQILNRLSGKLVKSNKLDFEFQGSSKDFLRSE